MQVKFEQDKEIEVKELRKQLEQSQTTQNSLHMRWVSIDLQISQIKNKRHDLIEQIRRKAIELPTIGEYQPEPSQTQQTQTQKFAMDDKFMEVVDFASIKKNSRDESQFEKISEEYLNRIKEIAVEMEKLAPNRKAPQRLEEISAQLKDSKEKFAEMRKSKENIENKFKKVKEKRYNNNKKKKKNWHILA